MNKLFSQLLLGIWKSKHNSSDQTEKIKNANKNWFKIDKIVKLTIENDKVYQKWTYGVVGKIRYW